MAVNTESASVGIPDTRQKTGLGSQALAFVECLILGVWIGSMIFFSFCVAPSAFAVLPSRHLAGEIVTSTISKVEIIGMVSGALLVLIHLGRWRTTALGTFGKVLKLVALLLMTGAASTSRFWVSPTMSGLRARMGGIIDEVSTSDPLRLQFDDLHRYSVGLMTTALIAGFVALFLTTRSWMNR
jgi:hypothetical protein